MKYLSASEVREITSGHTAVRGFQDGVGMGNGRFFIPSAVHPGGFWGFREVSKRRFYCWVFLRSDMQELIPGDILLALQLRKPSAIRNTHP